MRLQVRHQTSTIGIVSQQYTVIGQLDGVDGARPFGPGAQAVNQRKRLLLERYCDIAPLAPLGKEGSQGRSKLVDGRFSQTILQLLLSLSGKQGMNEGGLAVAHRVAKNQITIHQRVPSEGNIPI